MSSQTQALSFRISSELKNIIGKDLITDDFIAVFELVKNAYDAFAKNVLIRFEEDKITIQDDGKGMTFEDLRDKWLFVAYSAKKEGKEDDKDSDKKPDYRDLIQQRKYYAGAKGIGRFSCDRLGEKLTLTTKKWNSEARIEQIEVNWKLFEEDATREFVKVNVQHQSFPPSSFPSLTQGTILEITGLHSKWDHGKLVRLKRSLEKLINPFESLDKMMGKKSSDFSVTLDVPSQKEKDLARAEKPWEIVNGPIQNFIFETLNIKTTFVSTEITKDSITTKLVDRGVHMFTIREPNTKFKLLENAHIQLFFLNRAAKNNFTRRMGVQPVQFGSIFLFKNGFRIYPYGNEGDDSWAIDRKKQQGQRRFLGTRDVLGRVEILGDSEDFKLQFKEVSSRSDGLVETKGRMQLHEAYRRTAHRILQKYVVDVQWAYKETTYGGDPNLKDNDTDKEDISALNNVKGKSRVIRVLRLLSASKDVEILFYNEEFLNILDQKLEAAPPQVFSDLEKIAKKSNNNDFAWKVLDAEEKFLAMKKAKEEAERNARIAEEARQKAEEEKRKAELEKQEAQREVERKELERLRAEKAQREAEEREKEAQEKVKVANKDKQQAIAAYERERSENLFHSSLHSKDVKELASLQHHVDRATDKIKNRLIDLQEGLSSGKSTEQLMGYVKKISLENEKIKSIAQFFTQANFNLKAKSIKQDLILFIKEYIENVHQEYEHLKANKQILHTEFHIEGDEFMFNFRPLEIIIIIDNLYDNAFKARAKNIMISMESSGNQMTFSFEDDGVGISPENLPRIFDFGFSTNSQGSGIGLYHVKQVIHNINAGPKQAASLEATSKVNKYTTFTFTFTTHEA